MLTSAAAQTIRTCERTDLRDIVDHPGTKRTGQSCWWDRLSSAK